MYDPTIGQFISEDPIKFKAGDPNLRRYVGNSPTNATDPSGLFEQDVFWKGALLSAKGMGLPTFLIQWAKENEITIKQGSATRYWKFWNSIEYSDSTQVRRCERIGKAGTYNPATDRGVLGGLYNEVFHAWFDQSLENNKLKAAWLWNIIRSQDHFGSDQIAKAEEAMSETINQVVNEIGRPIPTYDEIMRMPQNSTWRTSLTPGHNEKGQVWAGDPGADKLMTEELYYATLWILDNGFENCLPHRRPFRPGVDSPLVAGLDDGNVLLELKRHFATRHRPGWTAGETNSFRNATPRREFKLPWEKE